MIHQLFNVCDWGAALHNLCLSCAGIKSQTRVTGEVVVIFTAAAKNYLNVSMLLGSHYFYPECFLVNLNAVPNTTDLIIGSFDAVNNIFIAMQEVL